MWDIRKHDIQQLLLKKESCSFLFVYFLLKKWKIFLLWSVSDCG